MQKRKQHISLPLIVICFALGFLLIPSIIGNNLRLLRKRKKRYLRVNGINSSVDERFPNYQQKGKLTKEIEPLEKEKKEISTYWHSLEDIKNSAEHEAASTDVALTLETSEENFPSDNYIISKQAVPTIQESITIVNTGIGEELTIKLDNGLCPEELILLNWYRNNNRLTTDLLPQDLFNSYGLDDNNLDYVNNLLSNGFLRKSITAESLPLLKVVELKELLRSYSLKVSGKKQELIDRLMDNLAKDDLEKAASRKAYILTRKGEQALAEHKDLIEDYQIRKKKK